MKRKWIAALVACSLLSSQIIWASQESSQLEQVLIQVKKKVALPEPLTDFSYYSDEDTYHFSWSQEDGQGSVDITCEKDGDLLRYYYYDGKSTDSSKLAGVNYQQAKKKAEAFLKQAVPEYAGQLKLFSSGTPKTGDTYSLEYGLVHNDIKVMGQRVNVSIDKQSGEVTAFNGLRYKEQAVYGKAVPEITLDKAQKLYLSEIGLPLSYQCYSDDADTPKTFLAYQPQEKEAAAIDAIKGKKVLEYIEPGSDEETGYGMGSKENSDMSAADVAVTQLSPEEQEAVDKTSGLMDAKALKKKIAAYFPILDKMSIASTNTCKEEEHYWRQINCVLKENNEATAWVNFSCDADTGEMRWYDYSVRGDAPKPSSSWTQQQAVDLVNKLNPEKAKEIKLDSEDNPRDEQSQTFNFTRTYKGIPVNGYGIYVTYDKGLKAVTSYRVDWNEELKSFPSAQGVITPDQAVKKIGIGLYYMETAENKYDLVYAHENNWTCFDAFTGHKVNYKGEEIIDREDSVYTDIAGHPDEEIFKQLYDSGVYLEGQKLNPNETITQGEMLRLIIQATCWYYDEGRMYEDAIDNGIISAEEEQPDKQLTKGDGVKYLINASPYKPIAGISDIYRCPYDKITPQLKGYVTLAYGLKIIDGKAFDPEMPLTKAEAMVMIYRFMQQDKGTK